MWLGRPAAVRSSSRVRVLVLAERRLGGGMLRDVFLGEVRPWASRLRLIGTAWWRLRDVLLPPSLCVRAGHRVLDAVRCLFTVVGTVKAGVRRPVAAVFVGVFTGVAACAARPAHR